MYDLGPDDQPPVQQKRIRQRRGFFETWWALALIALAGGGLVTLILGGYLASQFPDFPRLIITTPVSALLGLVVGQLWGNYRRNKQIEREVQATIAESQRD